MNLSHKRGAIREKDLGREIYFSDQYFSKAQLFSFAHQIHEIAKFKPSTMIEIGIGNGFVSSFFRRSGVDVTTVDINPALEPDICAPLDELDGHIGDRQFDLVVCCEVLEHMPYADFEKNIKILRGLSENAFITVPCYRPWFGIAGHLSIPKLRRPLRLGFRFPRFGPFRKQDMQMHFWEVGCGAQTGIKRIIDSLETEFSTVTSGFFEMNPYHQYFSCRGK